MRSLTTAGAVLALAIGAGACGNERVGAPDLSALGKGGKTMALATSDGRLRLRYPASWTLSGMPRPVVAIIASGSAVDTVYAYPRRDLGTDPAAVRASRKRIIRSLEQRAPGFLVQGTRITKVDGAPAVEVIGRGAIAGHVVRARTVHVFKDHVEWVFDAYATPPSFAAANRIAFGPILRSAKLADRAPREVPDTGATGATGPGGAGA